MSAIETFRRAMRRHEKRARRMGLRRRLQAQTMRELASIRKAAELVNVDQLVADAAWMLGRSKAAHLPQNARDEFARMAFVRRLAADAVARLRIGLAAEAARRTVTIRFAGFDSAPRWS